MSRRRILRASLVAALLWAAGWGCPKVRPVSLDRKTQLEYQILGTFQRLEQDLVLASSVRGPAEQSELSPLQREAVEAMMTREFLRDDIEALKQEQLVGEGRDGLLVALAPPKEAARARQVEQLLAQENKSRQVILRRVIQLNRELSDKDLPLIQSIFAQLARQTARPGDKLQRSDGAWEVVPEQASESAPGRGRP